MAKIFMTIRMSSVKKYYWNSLSNGSIFNIPKSSIYNLNIHFVSIACIQHLMALEKPNLINN